MDKSMEFKFSYKVNSKTKEINIRESLDIDDLAIDICVEKLEYGSKIDVFLTPKRELEIEKVLLEYKYNYEESSKVFLNGFQSWSDSREFYIKEKLKGISPIVPNTVIKKNSLESYGDYHFKEYSKTKGVFHGFTYSYIRNNNILDFIGSLSERSGYTIIEHDTNRNKIIIEKECKGIKILDKYLAFSLVFLRGDENLVFDKYFEYMNIPKPQAKPMNGYTSWYNHYQNISEEVILDNLESMASSGEKFDIFQIDDGFQVAVGDWLKIDKAKFPRGMKVIVDEIKRKSMIPGLWLAPFACDFNSTIIKEHPEWILKNEDGSYVTGGCNWDGFYALDIYNEELRSYLRNVFDVVLNVWGFELVKLDFLYATAITPRNNKSRGEIMCDAMDFLRECVGDKLILGCGVPLGPAFGKVDFCRIGCDIGLDWDDKWYMRLLHRERVSTKNAIISSIGRRQLNGRAFLNDPDVFLLRDTNIKLNNMQKETLAFVNKLFGSLLFTSDNIKDYSSQQKEVFKKCMNLNRIEIVSVEQDINLNTKVMYIEEGNKFEGNIDILNGSYSIKKI